MEESEARELFCLFGLCHEVVGIGNGRSRCVGNAVTHHDPHHVLFALILFGGGRVGRSLCTPGGGTAALVARIHIGLIVIADIDDILVSLCRRRNATETDVKGGPVSCPANDLRLCISPGHEGRFDTPRKYGSGPEGTGNDIQEFSILDETPLWEKHAGRGTSRRHDEHDFIPKGLQKVPQGQSHAAPGAETVGRHDIFAVTVS